MAKKLLAFLSAFALIALGAGRSWAGDSVWEGFYAGADYGLANSTPQMSSSVAYSSGGNIPQADIQTINSGSLVKPQLNNMTYSARAGYNFDLGQGLVAGLQGDFGAMSIKINTGTTGNLASNPAKTFTFSQATLTSWTAMIRPRIGVDMGGVLLYGTSGLAFTELSYQQTYGDGNGNSEYGGNNQFFLNGNTSANVAGLILGGGLEFKLNSQMSLNSEFLFLDYGNFSVLNDGTNGNVNNTGDVFTNTVSLTSTVFQMALNCRL